MIGGHDGILSRLRAGHDLHQCALLETPLPKPLPPQSALPGEAAAIRRFEPDWLLVEVNAKTNALLVLAEAWYPGWRAEINGQLEASVPANLWMRAFPVPPGRSEVRLFFRQNYLWPGAAVSCLSAVAALLTLALGRRPSRGR